MHPTSSAKLVASLFTYSGIHKWNFRHLSIVVRDIKPYFIVVDTTDVACYNQIPNSDTHTCI